MGSIRDMIEDRYHDEQLERDHRRKQAALSKLIENYNNLLSELHAAKWAQVDFIGKMQQDAEIHLALLKSQVRAPVA